jgi:hypothetical protein
MSNERGERSRRKRSRRMQRLLSIDHVPKELP